MPKSVYVETGSSKTSTPLTFTIGSTAGTRTWKVKFTISQACTIVDLVSISSTFYAQLLRSKVPKVPNDTADLTSFFALSESTCVKAVYVGRTLVKLTPGVGNSFGFTGHIRDKFGFRGPVHFCNAKNNDWNYLS